MSEERYGGGTYISKEIEETKDKLITNLRNRKCEDSYTSHYYEILVSCIIVTLTNAFLFLYRYIGMAFRFGIKQSQMGE